MKFKIIIVAFLGFILLNIKAEGKIIVKVSLKNYDPKILKEIVHLTIIDSTVDGQLNYVSSGEIVTNYKNIGITKKHRFRVIKEKINSDKNANYNLVEILKDQLVYQEFLFQKKIHITTLPH